MIYHQEIIFSRKDFTKEYFYETRQQADIAAMMPG